MKLYIGIPSTGRSGILSETLKHISSQILLPELVILCTPSNEPYGNILVPDNIILKHLKHSAGSCSQRNAILDYVSDHEGIILIIDDDFFLHREYLFNLKVLFEENSGIALINGKIIKDGIIGPGICVDEANSLLENEATSGTYKPTIWKKRDAYGCNMGIRISVTRNTRFDENLPLYGWLEDVDYSTRLSRLGKIVDTDAIAGVHLGTKLGRTPGVRFGYSQVANPVYLIRKGTMGYKKFIGLVPRNVIMNLLKSFSPEPYIDRRGRLLGNFIAIKDCFLNRANPQKILELAND